ncbi:Oidioi.mRNA.OKI2018_I69.chr2.g4576.t1.cds [Oikopleura dioica]|uniref:Oidioi.mRNA.OKI2018_I69.chr2.g4576.t1.cds n=1 Tax=Oikopleura dioica TaxID=34765 RepID=A0ABN7T4C9_OIKDI|nr:Oidioi.mRNA.OKI2018_I69.chr2.g4576.t1.cds [Oikopleura dioica]
MRISSFCIWQVCFSENLKTDGNPCKNGVTVKNLPEWEGNYVLDGQSDNGHPIYVANGDERYLYVIETFGVKKWHFSYLPDGLGAYAWGNFHKNCPSEQEDTEWWLFKVDEWRNFDTVLTEIE